MLSRLTLSDRFSNGFECLGSETAINGVSAWCDPLGGLYLPDLSLLVVSDLHLEKGAAFARRGRMLPPYDTIATLNRVIALDEVDVLATSSSEGVVSSTTNLYIIAGTTFDGVVAIAAKQSVITIASIQLNGPILFSQSYITGFNYAAFTRVATPE